MILTIVALSQTYLYITVPPIRIVAWFPMVLIVEGVLQAGPVIFLTVILPYFIFATPYLMALRYFRRRFAILTPIGLYLLSVLIAWFILIKFVAGSKM
jgi:hypothetical protein